MKKTVMLVIVMAIACGFFGYANGNQESTTYVNRDPVFSFEYPVNYEEGQLQYSTEVVRLVAVNQYKLPVIVANVHERAQDYSESDITPDFIARMQKKIPGSSGYSITGQKAVTLSDGTKAYLVTFQWTWLDGKTVMETASITVLQDDAMITMAVTGLSGLHPLDKAIDICMTLKMGSE
jgi:hypothetical protein